MKIVNLSVDMILSPRSMLQFSGGQISDDTLDRIKRALDWVLSLAAEH